MDFFIPQDLKKDLKNFQSFLDQNLKPKLFAWQKKEAIPRRFFKELGKERRLGFQYNSDRSIEESALKHALMMECMAKISPGVAIAYLVQMSLGITGLFLFASEELKKRYLESAVRGETLICAGSTENIAGSDVAGIATRAEKVKGGWKLNGSKAYVTNGSISDLAIVTAITDPEVKRSRRLSLFLVDLSSKNVTRKKLNKRVWIPSDLTRLEFKDVLIPGDNLLGERGKGVSGILEIFTHSRITIAAHALGTALAAFELGLDRTKKRKIFGTKIFNFQAKSFEIADLYSQLEAARLMVWKACLAKDQGQKDFRLQASMAKYLSVEILRNVSQWSADLYGAASVVYEHPAHKYPMEAWASSLGEGTQDIQKLVIFREVMKKKALWD
jgi:alkylation response protein AidB-like acyl-CoA dehydrogenase